MTDKAGKSMSLVPAGRKTPTRRKAASLVAIAATAETLFPVLRSPAAVAKLVGEGGEVVREEGVTLVTGRAYATRDGVVPAEEVYYDQEARPKVDGPWLGEADKVAWRDPETGYHCIMLRDTGRGFLCGYVGVPRDHPLWGWESGAVPSDLGIDVHGGLNFSEVCQDGPSPQRRVVRESRRICHVPPPRYEPIIHASDHRVEDPHAWWFGFSCDHVYDLVPEDRRTVGESSKAEVGARYRDDAYVIGEITALAAQLKAISAGEPVPARPGPPPPPIGLDPDRGGRA